MPEIIFLIEQVTEGGFIARAINESIFTEAETIEQLKANCKEAAECHFDEPNAGLTFLFT